MLVRDIQTDENGWTWLYDFENHLVKVNNASGQIQAKFRYDALGRRIERIDFAAGVTTRYCYDGQQTIAEYDGNNALKRYFINGGGYIDEHLLMRDLGIGRDRYYLHKELYTVFGLADSVGAVQESYVYDAYGRLDEPTGGIGGGDAPSGGPGGDAPEGGPTWPPPDDCEPDPDPGNPDPPPPPENCGGGSPFPGPDAPQAPGGSTSVNPFYFTGQRLDRIGGTRQVYQPPWRAYDPWHARFLQRDPAEYVDTLNLYEYVRSA
ncbi:MAG TPA: RHS repeat-associated core domain-containing protein, partial [Phycisphaerae bacterium]